IRFRLYATAGITAIDVATISAFCSLSLGIGLATVGGRSLLFAPAPAARVLHLHHTWSLLVGTLLLIAVSSYALWASLARGTLEFRGWALRAPGAALGLTQIALSVMDLSLSSAVLWWLLPPPAHLGFATFCAVDTARALGARPGAGAGGPVHRTGGAADRRRPHLPRRGAAAVLRRHAGDRRAARVPAPVPAARGAGGVAPRREPRGPRAAGAVARAVPP